MRFRNQICALAFCSTFFSFSTAAQTLNDLMPPTQGTNSARALQGRMPLFDHVMSYQLPVWSRIADGPAPAEETRILRAQKGNLFRLDMLPKGETMENWRDLFSIVAQNHHRGNIVSQAQEAVDHFKESCSPRNMRLLQGRRSKTRMAIVLACGNYSKKKDQGAVAAVFTIRQGDLAVSLIRQWRAKAFRSEDPNQWPLKRAEIEGVIRELGRTRLAPVNRN